MSRWQLHSEAYTNPLVVCRGTMSANGPHWTFAALHQVGSDWGHRSGRGCRGLETSKMTHQATLATQKCCDAQRGRHAKMWQVAILDLRGNP